MFVWILYHGKIWTYRMTWQQIPSLPALNILVIIHVNYYLNAWKNSSAEECYPGIILHMLFVTDLLSLHIFDLFRFPVSKG